MIPLFVQSNNGHDTLQLPEDSKSCKEAVNQQLDNDMWVTIAKKDGGSEIVTAKDEVSFEDNPPQQEEEKTDNKSSWLDTFSKDNKDKNPTTTAIPKKKITSVNVSEIESITATNKAKGG